MDQANPNVLVIMADQLKANATHLQGSSFCQTPALARLAAEGVLYENASHRMLCAYLPGCRCGAVSIHERMGHAAMKF
ncbi:MAG: sulfatase-like hydrolase/transferase [Lentisphaerae bacterium]|nr:sulfatase-like hydrolase/transferase [Lentisphaerota bacterium]